MAEVRRISRRNLLQVAGLTAGAGLMTPFVATRGRAQAMLSVNIANAGGNLTAVLQQILAHGRYFEKEGVDAKISNVSDGSKLLASIISGSSDVVMMSGFSQVFPAIEKGAKVKIIGGAVTLGQQAIFSKRDDIHEVKDLVGKTIGVGAVGSQLHQVVVALLLKHGIDPGRVTFANIGSSTDVFRAVAAGKVDAGPAQIDFLKQQDKFGVHTLKDANFWQDLPEYTFQAAYTSSGCHREQARSAGADADRLLQALSLCAELGVQG